MLSHSVMSDSLWPHGLQLTRLLCPWGFSRPECWSGLPYPPPGDVPNPGMRPKSPRTAGKFFTIWASSEAHEYWSEEPIPSPADFPNPGTEVGSPALQADSLPAELPGKPKLRQWLVSLDLVIRFRTALYQDPGSPRQARPILSSTPSLLLTTLPKDTLNQSLHLSHLLTSIQPNSTSSKKILNFPVFPL